MNIRKLLGSRVGQSIFRLMLGIIVIFATGHIPLSAKQKAGEGSATMKAMADKATLSGTVDAPKPFKAAQVYIRNVDKRILYMVYTSGGQYRAVDLFPGNYEVNVQTKGMLSDVQKLEVKAGDHPVMKLSMHESPDPNFQPSANMDAQLQNKSVTTASYDQIYPPGAGKEVVENICMTCHGENYFNIRPRSDAALRSSFYEHMLGSKLMERGRIGLAEGILAGPVTRFSFGIQDRDNVLDYLSKNFGPDSKPRAVELSAADQIPVDEAKLGKAEYMEYYLDLDPAGKGVNDPKYKDEVGGFVKMRQGTVVQLDTDGNAWLTDRGIPNRLVKLDPRTGEQKSYIMPEPRAGLHDLTIDRTGIVWVPELINQGTQSMMHRDPQLHGFNPKTEQWQYNMVLDPDNVIRNEDKGGILGIVSDAKGNLWMNWMMNGGLEQWDRETGKKSIYLLPTQGSVPYGNAIDKNDNVWISTWDTGKIVKFDTASLTWTEYTPPSYPVNTRRSVSVDSKNNVWFCEWAAGKRPGRIAKLDQSTGHITEYTVPSRDAQPYETSPDTDDNIWFPEQPDHPYLASSIVEFNTHTQTFTFYPKPQFVADTSKLIHATNGAIWYSPRSGRNVTEEGASFGVLYPDKDKITSFAAYPQNGPPGYAYAFNRGDASAKPTSTSK